MKNDDLHEILDIFIEECAECIQNASKVKRFGEHDMNPTDPDYPNGEDNAKKLFREIADLKAMMTLLMHTMDGFNQDLEWEQSRSKLCKLKKWSNINHDFLDYIIGLYDE